MMGIGIAGRLVIVTGGSQGIGRAIVERFAQFGARVVIADVDEAGSETARQLCEEGHEAHFVRCDVSSYDDIQALASEVQAKHGTVHTLVNNAGIFPRADLLHTDEAFWERLMGINLKGAYLMCQAFVPGMIEQGVGSIVNIGSTHARSGDPAAMAYAVSKGGLITLTRNLAKGFAKHGIRVNCVQPGWVASEGETSRLRDAGVDPDKLFADVSARMPMGRIQTGQDIADSVIFMASSLSLQVTGQVLTVDGGSSLR
ncbi:SDR family NAD(P)-dependent oxidoreductase [Paenibacillus sacheonensis]|uniref:Glucose 1-dehydrogenase n=1 Tax=Paenibacillus sacheonensis TaxID=742054 RepID=A0A7X4YN98_9BACL|nr:SDR family oxidoreductase [Paenibacillus sacheonensis]MBM7565564.1 NAD(P)-dependent dehydrogenase (short-subunit alcohol dehydrogenase family) [Paenibacillus sacheonensis]NBC69517.1 glucose 1-dehydrogenase [Paenibacillus sacheonensis]